MADLAALQVQLELQTAQFTEQMKKVNGELDKLNNKVDSVSNTFKSLGKTLAGAVSFGVIVAVFQNATNAMDEMLKSSQKLGVATDQLQALKFAASQSGVSFESLSTGLRIFNKSLADVAEGTTDTAKALRAIGVAAGDDTLTALKKVADAFAGSEDGAQKTAVAMALFGKAGAELIPLLNEGSAGIEQLMKRAEELGIVIGGETLKQAERFNDSMDEMRLALQGVVMQITAGMLPNLSNLAEGLAESTKVSTAWHDIGAGLGVVFNTLAAAVTVLITALEVLAKTLGGLAVVFKEFFSGNFRIAGSLLGDLSEQLQAVQQSAQTTIGKFLNFGESAKKTSAETDKATVSNEKLKKSFQELSSAANQAALDLSPAQKTILDLHQQGQAKKFAAEQIKAFKELPAEALKSFGLTVKQLEAYQESLKRTAGVWKDAGKGATEAQKPLTAAQQILVDMQKQGAEKQNALDLLAESAKLSEEAIKSLGLTTEEFAAKQEALKKSAGVWTVLDEAISSIAKKAKDTQDFSTAWEKLTADFQSGAIAIEVFVERGNKLIEMQDKLGKGGEKVTDFSKSIQKLGEDITLSIATNATNAMNDLIDSFGEAEVSFGDLITAMLKDIAKLVTQLLIIEPLMKSIKGMNFFGGGSTAAAGTSSAGFVIPAAPTVPTLGTMAAMPANFSTSGGGHPSGGFVTGSNMEVNVYNNADVEVTTKKSEGADGTQVLDMYIDRRISQRFSDGSMDKMMRSNFGIMRNAGA